MFLCRNINDILRNGNESEALPRRKRNIDDQQKLDSELTGSELVRKYVTFHFFFPVGQHSPLYTLSGLWYLSTPLFTRYTGLLQYRANCKRVRAIYQNVYNVILGILIIPASYLYSYFGHTLIATTKCGWSKISWLCRIRETIYFLSLKT